MRFSLFLFIRSVYFPYDQARDICLHSMDHMEVQPEFTQFLSLRDLRN
jgi:hypothetical protein